MKKFTMKEEHLVLIGEFFFQFQLTEFGAPEVDPKRPYGNSSVIRDLKEILGDSYEEHELRELHEETTNALQILSRNLDKFPKDLVGNTYVSDYGYDWRQVINNKGKQ